MDTVLSEPWIPVSIALRKCENENKLITDARTCNSGRRRDLVYELLGLTYSIARFYACSQLCGAPVKFAHYVCSTVCTHRITPHSCWTDFTKFNSGEKCENLPRRLSVYLDRIGLMTYMYFYVYLPKYLSKKKPFWTEVLEKKETFVYFHVKSCSFRDNETKGISWVHFLTCIFSSQQWSAQHIRN